MDVLIDDGGHMPQQMWQTLLSTFPDHISPGGYFVTEDIHGDNVYLHPFLLPVADWLGAPERVSQVASVHLFPFLMMVKKAGGTYPGYEPNAQAGLRSVDTVSSFADLLPAIAKAAGSGYTPPTVTVGQSPANEYDIPEDPV